MAAVDSLLGRLAKIDEVVDFISIAPPAASPHVLDFASRAVAIQGLSSFEQFLRERSVEWAAHLTAARIPATQLPGGSIPLSNRIVATLPRRFRDLDDPARQLLVQGLAATLASLSAGSFVGHDLLFSWSGSNVQVSDVEDIIKLVGYDRGWGEATAVWAAIDPRKPPAASAESVMKAFATLRHTVAHDVDSIPNHLDVLALTRNIKITSMLVDVIVSRGISLACAGKPTAKGFASALMIRRIAKDRGTWPEYGPGRTRAIRRHSSLGDAMSAAGARARINGEVVLAYDGFDLANWQADV